ncbi:tRNA-intron lyase [Candidatus Woesearchaeota archaeon]|nr:tRNA-intron lyase [Candidatus Woesearchaeota archaeon]
MAKRKSVKKTIKKTKTVKKKTAGSGSAKSVSSASKKELINAVFFKDRVVAEKSDASRNLYNQSRFGTLLGNGELQFSFIEALFLLEKGKIQVKEGRKKLTFDKLLKLAEELEPQLWTRYCVFKDLRTRGYIVQTALKFGADFRVYDRGVKPGEDHAKWLVFSVSESQGFTWYDFSAKTRVANSTKKRLLIAVVDRENDVTYYEIRWLRP